ncbi:hypothetical protein TPHA_0P01290 [Tetrapisispora phaffii CBS 4417]|uniref:Transcription activator GCR1-like domain-containing protein n=1 Tax=Tetrapisispora phaffii (strain ATCC 24235 / CBS 4417 / NBRC 1672 / NRRL Y-8282 / UCD 70-5) TaxID=1071381 RepID=G8C2A9_TETPH|nr:hypothetical protein TPHA_0P01290 [Tetrapisispora phaffii CBS 4417]CCE66287.1 hypothetical protein TPHA_0P01290 [Tetrapisispora phaffii CBS 4417]
MDIIEGDGSINNRVGDLERQVLMFERMLLTLSGTLDQHFKKYDMLISTQQQQMAELNAIISTLLNDQYRHSEITREKLSSALHGISATSASVSTTMNDTSLRVVSNSSNSNDQLPVNDGYKGLHGNIDINRLEGSSMSQSSSLHTPLINNSAFLPTKLSQSSGIQNTNNMVNDYLKTPVSNYYSTVATTMQNSNSLNHSSISIAQDPGAVNVTEPIKSGNVIFYNQAEKSTEPTRNISVDDRNVEMNGTRQRKKKKNVFVGEFQFIKSPHSILDLWKEYTEGINGQPSIRELESIYQTGWRRDPAVNKRFSRRKVLYKAIENGLNRGYTLEYIIDLLEDFRFTDETKKQKRPIGWIFHSANIPNLLK